MDKIRPIDNYYLHQLKLRLKNLKSMRALSGFMGAGPWLDMLNSSESGIMVLRLADLDDRIDLISRAIKREREVKLEKNYLIKHESLLSYQVTSCDGFLFFHQIPFDNFWDTLREDKPKLTRGLFDYLANCLNLQAQGKGQLYYKLSRVTEMFPRDDHLPGCQCKGICHDGMRCVDLPNHAEICQHTFLNLNGRTLPLEEILKLWEN